MTRTKWKNRIKAACVGVGTYKTEFDAVIEALADILSSRDEAHQQFIDSGGQTVIEYTNKGGATNLVKNPYMVRWMDLNTQALSYWRDLGLTPSGLKKMGESIKVEQKSSLASILAELK